MQGSLDMNVQAGDPNKQEPASLPRYTRWLAIGAGVLATFVFLPYGLPGLLLASMPIVGAAVEPYIGRAGKWLLIAGAMSLTVVGAAGLFALVLRERSWPGSNNIVFTSLLTISMALIVWCDVALIIHGLKTRHSPEPPERPYFRPLHWLVWMNALFGSVLFFPEAVRESMQLRHHVLGVTLGDAVPSVLFPSLVLLALDFALVINEIKTVGSPQTAKAKHQ
jgi:hypothetical protein